MILPIEKGNITDTLNQFFKTLLKKNIVDALLVPQVIFSEKSIVHTLIKDPDQIKHATPFVPFLMNNGATATSVLTTWDPKQTVGVVLRSCEIRAVVELAKFKQASLERLFLIGVDCLGTMDFSHYKSIIEKNSQIEPQSYLKDLLAEKKNTVRRACQVCIYPVPENVQMQIGFIGIDSEKGLFVEANEEIAKQLDMLKKEEVPKRDEQISKIVEKRKKERDQQLTELKKRFQSVSDLLNEFAQCKRCYNCRTECPICYCKECVFLTNIFAHKPDEYMQWAERKGAIKIPYDTLLFHLTRLNHMATSCVECGMCSSACPNELPVFELFQYIGNEVQALFEYVPGRNVEEDPPFNTFKESELEPN